MVILEESDIMQPLYVARTWYYLDIFLNITKCSQNIMFSAFSSRGSRFTLLTLYLRLYCLCVCVRVRVCVCGVIKGALVMFST